VSFATICEEKKEEGKKSHVDLGKDTTRKQEKGGGETSMGHDTYHREQHRDDTG